MSSARKKTSRSSLKRSLILSISAVCVYVLRLLAIPSNAQSTPHPHVDAHSGATSQSHQVVDSVCTRQEKRSLISRLSLGGYGEVTFTRNFFSDNVNRYSHAADYKYAKGHGRFDIPHVVIMLGFDFGKGWSMGSEIEFEHGGVETAVEMEQEEVGEFEKEIERGGEVALEQFWIQKSFLPQLNVRAGHIVVPVGGTNASHLPTEFFTVFRPEGENQIMPCTWHQTGMKVCETFLAARAWWEKSEAFLFGPASDFGIDPHIDSWPLDRAGLQNQMDQTSHLEAMEAEDGDAWAGTHLGPELLGFHGIEYIIFADGAPKSSSMIPDNELTYALAVAGDLRNKCWQLLLSWAGENNVGEEILNKVDEELEWPFTISGGSYKENMLNAGNAGSTYRTWTDAMEAIVDGCIDITDEVGTMKIGKPYSGEDVNYIESPYSHKSITDFYDNMVSVENAYMGGIDGLRNEALSLHAYIKSVDPVLDSKCTEAIRNVKEKISSMAAPFVKNFSDPSAKAASDACGELTDVLTEVKAALSK